MHSTTCKINGDGSGSEQFLIHRITTNSGAKHSNNTNINETNGNKTNSNEDIFLSPSSSITDFEIIGTGITTLTNRLDDVEFISKLSMPLNNPITTITTDIPAKPNTLNKLLPNSDNHLSSDTNNANQTVISKSNTINTITTSTPNKSLPLNNIPNINNNILSNNNQLECNNLLEWKDMPKHLQFNPYVLTGYRPLQTAKGCLNSLFSWHNETINIFTHGIPIVYILVFFPMNLPWEKELRILSFCHLIGAIAPWCGSFIYHLFMNLERSEDFYYFLLKIDMLGIWMSQSFGAMPMITATFFCLDYKWKYIIILGYSAFSLWGLYKAMIASSPWQRRLCFALPFTTRLIFIILRTFRWVGGNPAALTHLYLQDFVSLLGGAIGAMNIPEKWFPGRVDLIFNSHNIMHILVVAAVYPMHRSTISDFEWMSKTECNNSYYNSYVTIDNSVNHHIDL